MGIFNASSRPSRTGASGLVNEPQQAVYPRGPPYPTQQRRVYTPPYPPPPPEFIDTNAMAFASPPSMHRGVNNGTPPYPPPVPNSVGAGGEQAHQESIAMYPFSSSMTPPSLSHPSLYPHFPPSASSQQLPEVPLPPLPPSDPSFLMYLPPPPPPSSSPSQSSSSQQPSPSPPYTVTSPSPPYPPPPPPHQPAAPLNLRHRHPFLSEEDVKDIKIGFEGAAVENEPMPKVEGHKRILLGAAGSLLGLAVVIGTASIAGIPALAGLATGLTTTGLGIGGLAWGSYKKAKSQRKRDEWTKKKLRERVSVKADPVLYEIQEKAKNIVRQSLLQSPSFPPHQDSNIPSSPYQS